MTTIEEFQNLANLKGGTCLSEAYVNCNAKLRFRCVEGHEWEATPHNIKSGSWCRLCGYKRGANAKKLSLTEMNQIAGSKGGQCLSSRYVDAKTKLKWQCVKGHIWEAAPHNIKNGNWCRICAGLLKLTLVDMEALARKHGGQCLSSRYVNSKSKLKWQCSEGHVWETKPDNIIQGSWCRICAGLAKLTIEEMQELARRKGGKCLSETYVNVLTKLR